MLLANLAHDLQEGPGEELRLAISPKLLQQGHQYMLEVLEPTVLLYQGILWCGREAAGALLFGAPAREVQFIYCGMWGPCSASMLQTIFSPCQGLPCPCHSFRF
jgi:hypothetical protein